MMQPILTISTNPAVDVSTTVRKVVPGVKLRCRSPRWDAGGGGTNVARAIRKLGGDALALLAVGGPMGERLLSLLAAEDVSCRPVSVSAETRISFAVTDEASGDQYRFGVPGETVTPEEAAAFLDAIRNAAHDTDIAVFSGSIAPGMPDDFVELVKDSVSGSGARLIVDTSGEALARLVKRPINVHVLRLDQAEAEATAGTSLPSVEECRNFASSLVKKGVAEIVVMGRGAGGSVLVSRDRSIHAWTPPVVVRSKIGAGDTFVGAFALSLARNEPLDIALKRGVSAASATVSTEGTALCEKADADALFARCRSEDL